MTITPAGLVPARSSHNGTPPPEVEQQTPFNPATDTYSPWKMRLFPSYRQWVEEGVQFHAQSVQDILDYNELLRKAIKVRSDIYARSGAANAAGGAGKSSLTASVASALADCSSDVVLVIDNNQAMGIIARYLGIPSDVGGMTVREAAMLAKAGKLENSADYSVRLRKSDYGVKLLRSDKVVRQEEQYGRDVAMLNMELSQKHYPIVFNDTSNGIQDPAAGGVWDMLNVLMLPTQTKATHMELSRETRETLYSWRSDKAHFGHLIENGITVVMGLRPGETLESYRYGDDEDGLHLPEDRLLFAQPFDERMACQGSINFKQSSIYYQIACREVALINLIVAQRQGEGRPLTAEERMSYKTGHLVKLESGRVPALPWIDGNPPIAIDMKGV